jgi:Uncharacterized alpha/beta hydrolase domain (DUF2235)
MATVDLQSRLLAGADVGSLRLPAAPNAPTPDAKAPAAKLQLDSVRQQPPAQLCQQTLTLSFFFDGTGNNLEADVATWEHSNVARLYRAHLEDDASTGRFRFYLPGIGTYFRDREVNDPGGKVTGNAFGALGQARLDFAFARLREKVTEAEARAENPTNKICWIKVSVFGFSRGAALARAFCRDLEKRCFADASSNTGWRLRQGRYPIEIVFSGLFDTVASAGLPPSSNNLQRNRYLNALGWLNPGAQAAKLLLQTPELKRLAFGNSPGADPAPGLFDGHGDWADGLAIGALVKRTFHIMAAHENRNSFALDTTLYLQRTVAKPGETTEFFGWPQGCTEFLYPGVHSDVGGGYRPGEGGCKPERGAQLSLVALRTMHSAAIEAGVPLVQLSGLTAKEREDFALDEAGAAQFSNMLDLFNHYMATVKTYRIAGASVGMGAEANQHMRAYYAWRFRTIRSGSATSSQQRQVTDNEAVFARDRAAIAAELKRSRSELFAAQQRQEVARILLENGRLSEQRFGIPTDPKLVQRHELAKRETERQQIAHDRLRARSDGAANDSELNAAISKYDKMLLEDATQIVKWMREAPALKLRPHYYALVEAYLDEYERGRGLTDAKIIAFFDDYVHDSLAGFDTDETWPSDPRIWYVGGDNKLRYAGLMTQPATGASMAA